MFLNEDAEEICADSAHGADCKESLAYEWLSRASRQREGSHVALKVLVFSRLPHSGNSERAK